MGRPTKLNDAVAAEIVELMESGAYMETAAEACGIATSTLYLWLEKGERGEEPYQAFSESVRRARARAELDMVDAVRSGDGKGEGFGKARAAAFMLERTRPNKYAQRVNLKVEDAVREVLEVVRGVCSPEDFARVCERLERLHSEGGEALPSGDSEAGPELH